MGESMDEALQRLAEKAKTLNDRTDAANVLLERANQKLSSMRLGVEVWLEDRALAQTIRDHGLPAQVQLGFAKVDGSWQLATREWALPLGDELGGRMPLAKQGREIRIKASAHIETLIEKITRQVDALLDATSSTPAERRAKP